MAKYTRTEARVALYIIIYGLRIPPDELTRDEKQAILNDVHALVEEGHDPTSLVNAARFGMSKVWPFSDEGNTWDSRDFRQNITKAKSGAARLRRAGQLPTPAELIKEREDGNEEG